MAQPRIVDPIIAGFNTGDRCWGHFSERFTQPSIGECRRMRVPDGSVRVAESPGKSAMINIAIEDESTIADQYPLALARLRVN